MEFLGIQSIATFRVPLSAEWKGIGMRNLDTPDSPANNPWVYVKDVPMRLKPRASKIIWEAIARPKPPALSRMMSRPCQFPDRVTISMQRLYIVSIALLAKSAETVKILTNLRISDLIFWESFLEEMRWTPF